MQIDKHPLMIVLQTVRLPQGRDQFVVPSGCPINRGQLLTELDRTPVDVSHHVIQPETGREGVERLVVLGAKRLTKSQEGNLRQWLQSRLKLVPDIIDDVTQHSTGNEIPASTVLARWQQEMRTQFPVSAMGRTNSASRGLNNRSLLVMSGFGLLAVAFWMMVQPISDLFSSYGSAKNDADNGDIPKLISNQWNLTNDEKIASEVDLLNLLDPLVAPTPKKSNRERLTHILQSINQVRLGNIAVTNKGELESDDKVLRRLLSDGALNSYVRKLISTDGTLDRFGQVVDNRWLAALRQLLPASADEKTAATYRQLARQLIGIAPIGPQGERLLDQKDPFFDFAENRNDFDLMVRSVPKSLSDTPCDCTFFTQDDCIAAREITIYFKSIKFLNERGLGFPNSDPRQKRLNTNSSRPIARLLNDWQTFNNPQPNQAIDDKPPETDVR